MDYHTKFFGHVNVVPPLSSQEIEYLNKFSDTRRMDRSKGPYFVNGTGYAGQDHESDIKDYNSPPSGQPSLWCHWVPTQDGSAIEWNGSEKFRNSLEWMKYLIEHFVGSNPFAKQVSTEEFSFLQSHTLNGEIAAEGESESDRWTLSVKDNKVTKPVKTVAKEVAPQPAKASPQNESWVFGEALSLREDAERQSRYNSGIIAGTHWPRST